MNDPTTNPRVPRPQPTQDARQMSRPTCKLVPYLRARCSKPIHLRKWRVRRTHSEVLTLPGRVCHECAKAIVNAHPSDYKVFSAGANQ